MSKLVMRDSLQCPWVIKYFLKVVQRGEDRFVCVGRDSGIGIANHDVGVFSLSGVVVELKVYVWGCVGGWCGRVVAVFSLGWEGVFPVFGGVGHGVKGGCCA